MEPIKLEMILRTFKSEFIGARNNNFLTVSTDSRKNSEEGIFFALTGKRFDGHDFVGQAVENGNKGLVINRFSLEKVKSQIGKRLQNVTIFAVSDTLSALGDLASVYLCNRKAKRVALTGSCGKTTTREIISSILSLNHRVIKTDGNLNNLIGLPLTAFRVLSDTEFAILEMGMNAPGEIKRLTEIALPHIALITNVRPAHIEGVGSLKGVLEAKWELFENAPNDCICVINEDDEMLMKNLASLRHKKVTFSRYKKSDVSLDSEPLLHPNFSEVRMRIGNRKISLKFHIPGIHNVDNLLAAAAVAYSIGVSPDEIALGAERVNPVSGRMEMLRLNNITVINDTYNANPASVESALRFLSSLESSQRVAILADMLELGMESYVLHNRIGNLIGELNNIDILILLGREVAAIRDGAIKNGFPIDKIFMAISRQDVVFILRKNIKNGATVLVKGSHSMQMEKVVEELKLIY